MRLSNIKDCKNCKNALCYGSKDVAVVKCNSINYEYLKVFRELGRHGAGQCSGYEECKGTRSGRLAQNRALQFILAGNSEFILHSTKNNEDYIYNIVKEHSANKVIYFVNIVHGHEKTYAGLMLENEETKEYEFKQGKNGKLSSNDLSIRSLIFVVNKLLREETVGNLEFYHLGKCGCCGGSLVTAENIEHGFCKICSKYK